MASNFHPFNKAHAGQFTRKAKAAGMSVQQFAEHVKGNTKYSTLTRRQAAGAKAAATWKH
jgi:hypothetical protein